jgi:uncharacterized membrane protein YfcA
LQVPDPKLTLLLLLSGIAVVFALFWANAILKQSRDFAWPTPLQCAIGFVTDFLDTLGVGSFAVTTALYRFTGTVDDEKMPGTLNVGHTLPTILQALIYIQVFKIDVLTLWLLIIASGMGSYLGAYFVAKLPKQKVQVGMGLALLFASGLLFGKLMGWYPKGSDETLGLSGLNLVIGIVGNFVFGALMTIGVGAYAPIMVMVGLLGMTETTAFPLMMGSCAFLMPVASYRFIKSGKYDVQAALGLTSLDVVKWLVLFVVIYTAASMLYAALSAKQPVEVAD